MMTDLTCGACGIVFAIPEHRYNDLRKTHETFYCPNGHPRHFPGKTENEKLIERLRELLENSYERNNEMWAEVNEAKQELRVCPYECGYVVKRKQLPGTIRFMLVEHLHEAHGADLPVAGELTESAERKALGSGTA